MDSTRAEDISSSLSEILMSVSRDGNLASRTSSPHSSAWSNSTSPRTLSAPKRVFCRSAYWTMAILSVSSSVCRSNMYALGDLESGSKK
ncbi:hypothetical protein D3C73_1186220 [compost metagenome]